TLCSATHCVSDRLLHSTAERNSLFKLLSNALCCKLSVKLGCLNFNNIDCNGLVEHSLALRLELLNFRAALTDNKTGLCTVNADSYSFAVTLNFNLLDTEVVKLSLQSFTEVVVLNECS